MTATRRKILLSIGIVFGVLILLLSSAGLFYYYSLTQTRKRFRSLETQEVLKDVYVLKTGWFINSWIFKTDKGLLAFDAGLGPVEIQREMAKLNLDPLDVVALLLTHTDKEHVGGITAFSKAKVYLAREEVQMIDGSTYRATFLYPKNRIAVPLDSLTTLEDGQDIEICGLKIHCILVPGHTLGSMAFVIDDKIVTGDTLSIINGHVELFNPFPFINMDIDQMKASISKMARLTGIQYILTMHFGYSDDFQKAFAGW